MLTTNDAARVFDTILSSPGMGEMVKMDFKMTRKNALLLCSVIERGLSAKEEEKGGLLENVPKENLQELGAFAADCLAKAGLTELSDKLKALAVK